MASAFQVSSVVPQLVREMQHDCVCEMTRWKGQVAFVVGHAVEQGYSFELFQHKSSFVCSPAGPVWQCAVRGSLPDEVVLQENRVSLCCLKNSFWF